MKALVYTEPEQLSYRDEAEPVPATGEVLVEIRAAGICGSDMHAYLGHDERRPAPLILGHEAAGIARGGKYDGQAVVINPLVTCGTCPACLSGRSNLCSTREIISMAPRQGTFAERVAVPEENLVAVPEGMDLATAALVEPLATGWHAASLAINNLKQPAAGSRALVFGGGAVGLAAALSLNAKGCTEIYLAETNELRRQTADSSGICTTFNPVNNQIVDANSVDMVVDCVGNKPTRLAAMAAIKPGGVIIHVGLLGGVDGMDVRKLTLQEVAFIGSYTYTMQDFKATLAAMHSGELGALDWFQERPLAEGASAFSDLLEGRIASAKVVLRPG